MINIATGSATVKEISVTIGEMTPESLKISEVDRIQFTFGKTVVKYFNTKSDSEVEYDPIAKVFLVPLSVEDTNSFIGLDQIPCQVRVKFVDGRIVPTDIDYANIQQTLSSEDF